MGIQAQSQSSNFVEGEKHYLDNRGKDYLGISENFQYHDETVRDKQIVLTNSDKFFREGFGPMHLMDYKFFNALLDDFLKWAQKQKFYVEDQW